MDLVIVYWSRYGNGKRIIEYLAKTMEKNGATTQVFRTDEADPAAMVKADLYVFSAPTEAFNIQRNMRTFLKKLQGMEGKKFGIINTHGMKRDWLNKMEKLLSKKKMIKVAGVDFQVGKDANTGNGLMEGWETKVEGFVEQLLQA